MGSQRVGHDWATFPFIQHNYKKTSHPIKEWTKNLKRHFFLEDIQMVDKHMEGCSRSWAIREMQIKTHKEIQLHRELALIKQTKKSECWWGCDTISCPVWWNPAGENEKWCSHLGKHRCFIKRLNIELSHNPETPFLNTYPRQIKTYFYIKLVHRCS